MTPANEVGGLSQWVSAQTVATALVCYGFLASASADDNPARPVSAQLHPWEENTFWENFARVEVSNDDIFIDFAKRVLEDSIQLRPEFAQLISENFWDLV